MSVAQDVVAIGIGDGEIRGNITDAKVLYRGAALEGVIADALNGGWYVDRFQIGVLIKGIIANARYSL